MKERLTGAIILVALMVLLVPELLTGPIRTKSAPAEPATAVARTVVAGQPPHAEPPLRSYTLTLGAPSSSSSSSSASSTESVSAPATAAPTQPVPPPPQTQTGAPQVQTHVPSAAAEVAPGLQGDGPPAYPAVREARSSASSTGWVVQLGSFASRPNADRLARSLEGRGFHMSVSPARAGSRVLWRVRAGPAHDRAGAQRLAGRLRALGHRGELLPVR